MIHSCTSLISSSRLLRVLGARWALATRPPFREPFDYTLISRAGNHCHLVDELHPDGAPWTGLVADCPIPHVLTLPRQLTWPQRRFRRCLVVGALRSFPQFDNVASRGQSAQSWTLAVALAPLLVTQLVMTRHLATFCTRSGSRKPLRVSTTGIHVDMSPSPRFPSPGLARF